MIYIPTYVESETQFLEISYNGLGIDLDQYGDKMFGMYKTFNESLDSIGIGLLKSGRDTWGFNFGNQHCRYRYDI